jgi:hypothetical protein
MRRFVATYRGRRRELPPGRWIVGREPGCDIVLEDPQCSRRHGAIDVGEDAASYEDLGSRNGSRVDGKEVKGTRAPLGPRSTIEVGEDRLLFGEMGAERADTMDMSPPEPPRRSSTAPAILLSGIAQKAIASGHVADAEQLLQKVLGDLMTRLPAGRVPDGELAEAARGALLLANATKKGSWLDWIFEAYSKADRVVPADVLDSLHSVVRVARYGPSARLRSYIDSVAARRATLLPQERFLLSRLEGLWNVCAGQ